MATYGKPRRVPGRNGTGRSGATAGAKRKGMKAMPPRRTGGSKMTPDGRNPMAHGGNC